MKPEEARRRRKADEAVRDAMDEQLAAFLKGDNPLDEIVPGLIPTDAERVRILGEIKRLGRRAVASGRGSRQYRHRMEEIKALAARLVFVDRVLEMDRLERAALTPRMLRDMCWVSWMDVKAKVAELSGQEGSDVA